MEPVKQKRKYTRKPKTPKVEEVEEVVKDIEDLSVTEAPKLERQVASPDQFNSVKPDPLAAPIEPKQTSQEIFSRIFRKPMSRTDVYFYTEDIEPDMNKYCLELQNELLEQGLGSQFVVYSDPKLPRFQNDYGVTNCWIPEDSKPSPFWAFCQGPRGSKAVNLKERPRKTAQELVELIKAQTTAYSDDFIDLVIIGAK